MVRESDKIDLPKELQIAGMKLEIAIDVVYINKEAFLHSVDRRIRCPNIVVLGTKAKETATTRISLSKGSTSY